MADAAEIVRLMRHAADLLDAQNPSANAGAVALASAISGNIREAQRRAAAEAVAIGNASAILRTVAALLTDEVAAEKSSPWTGSADAHGGTERHENRHGS